MRKTDINEAQSSSLIHIFKLHMTKSTSQTVQ